MRNTYVFHCNITKRRCDDASFSLEIKLVTGTAIFGADYTRHYGLNQDQLQHLMEKVR